LKRSQYNLIERIGLIEKRAINKKLDNYKKKKLSYDIYFDKFPENINIITKQNGCLQKGSNNKIIKNIKFN